MSGVIRIARVDRLAIFSPAIVKSFCLLALMVAALIIGGCTTWTDIVVQVRSARGGDPVSGAAVTIQPLSFFVPDYPYETLSPAAPRTQTARTDAGGIARVKASANDPNRLQVIAPGYAPFRAILEPAAPPARGSPAWRLSPAQDAGPTAGHQLVVEVRSAAR